MYLAWPTIHTNTSKKLFLRFYLSKAGELLVRPSVRLREFRTKSAQNLHKIRHFLLNLGRFGHFGPISVFLSLIWVILGLFRRF